jgi:hypothetical protein
MVAQRIVLAATLDRAVASAGLAAERQATMAVGVYGRASNRVENWPHALSISSADARGIRRSPGCLGDRRSYQQSRVCGRDPRHAPDFSMSNAYGDGVIR